MKTFLEEYGKIVVSTIVILVFVVCATPLGESLAKGVKQVATKLSTESQKMADNSIAGLVRLDGDGQTFHKMAPSTLSFQSTVPIEDFKEVQINGDTIDPASYSLTEGNTVVTLSVDYLQTLAVDTHEIMVVSDSGTPSANFGVITAEENEYGFYYNQPYCAYVSAYHDHVSFFFREGGSMDLIFTDSHYTEKATFTCENNRVVVNAKDGTFTGTVSDDGLEIYCGELDVTFALGNESIVADENYVYFYDSSLEGYFVTAIDKTKTSYSGIRTNINGTPTVALASKAFEKCENMTSVTIPSSITTISSYAFLNCSSLTSITIPDSVTYIDSCAFESCSNLTSITIQGSVTYLGLSTFNNCTSLTDVIIGDGVDFLGEYMFWDCSSLKHVTIGKSVESIGDGCFAECSSLASITIPDNVTRIGQGAFEACSSLTSITIPGNVTYLGRNLFYDCSKLNNIRFEGTVEQWKAMGSVDLGNIPASYIQCSDGKVDL